MLSELGHVAQNFEYILNGISDGVLILAKDFKIVWANRAVMKDSGRTPEDIIGNHCYSITHNRNSPCVPPHDTCPIMEVTRTGNPVVVVHTHFLPSGDKRYAEVTAYPVKDEDGEIVQFVHISKDVTERRTAEEKVENLYQMMRGILEKSPLGVYIVNGEGKIDYVNSAMLKIAGDTDDHFRALNVFTDIPAYGELGLLDKIKSIQAGGEYFSMRSVERVPYPGRESVVINIFGMPFSEGGQKKALIFVEDISELRHAEEMKDSLTHMIVHDLNHPLTVISGELQLLRMEMDGKLSEREQYDLESAFAAVRDLQGMIGDILDVNKMEEGSVKLVLENFALADVARQVVDQLRAAVLYEGKVLSSDISGDLPPVSADKKIMKRVIVNLINNSLKFTPPKGSVLLRIFYRSEDRKIYIQVKDTGVGISAEYLEKIFDKFVRVETKQAVAGRGLGLTFCKMMVEAHGGKIRAESEGLDKGSTFTVALPVGF
jgi:two-component system phosphate regulon sensor histidine kinase PhoR